MEMARFISKDDAAGEEKGVEAKEEEAEGNKKKKRMKNEGKKCLKRFETFGTDKRTC